MVNKVIQVAVTSLSNWLSSDRYMTEIYLAVYLKRDCRCVIADLPSIKMISAKWILAAIGLIAMVSQPLIAEEAQVFGESLDCSAQPSLLKALPPSPNKLRLMLPPNLPENALLEIREIGQDVNLLDDKQGRSVQTPPRYGVTLYSLRYFLSLDIQRVREGNGKGAVKLILHCSPDEAERLWQWYGIVQQLIVYFTGGIGSLSQAFPEAELLAVEGAVFDPYSHALAVHLRAQALFLAGRAADAAEAFERAANAWQAVNAITHASAALVGLVEDLNRSGQYDRVLELTRSRDGDPDGSHYYGARLENARCLALHYLGELDQAAQCYSWTSKRFSVLDETLELASTGLNFAAVERSRGKVDSARRLLLESAELAGGAQSFNVQGRAQFGLSGLAQGRGDVAEALARLQQAQYYFDVADEQRWQSAILLRITSLLIELRALGDARAAVTQAISMLDKRHAPARVAVAQTLLAQIEFSDRHPQLALQHIDEALTTYLNLNMPEEIARAQLLRSALMLRMGHTDSAAADFKLIQTDQLTSQVSATLHTLLAVELMLSAGNLEQAKNKLQSLSSASSLKQRLEYDRLIAETDWRLGLRGQAHAMLNARARELSDLSSASGNSLLNHLLSESVDNLRQTAIDLISQELEISKADVVGLIARLEPWLLRTGKADKPVVVASHSELQSDQALTRLLLADFMPNPSTADTSAIHSELLARLAHRTDMVKDAVTPSESAANVLDALVKPGKPLLVLLHGRTHLLRLWIEAGAEPSLISINPDVVNEHLEPLRSILSQPDGNLADIAHHTQALSEWLFSGLNERYIPEQLHVMSNRLATTIPWSLLHWPGDPQPLVERTSVSLIIPIVGEPKKRGVVERIDVLVTSQDGGVFSNLASAAVEPALIERHAAGRQVHTSLLNSGESALDALSQQGWLHLSAHGQTRNDRLIGSGLWIEPAVAGESPEFLSWIDVIEQGVGRDLLVLNACQLAESSNAAATAALDFATALSRAGARDTIAAQWPVSDTASAVWVPAFYQTLTASTFPDPAHALAEARQALRASRAFRHPFHWAGWVHITRVSVKLDSGEK